MNTSTASATVYSTATNEKASFAGLSEALVSELRLNAPENHTWSSDDQDWCFVCSRPTDHRGEHDDLVDAGHASYDNRFGVVYSS